MLALDNSLIDLSRITSAMKLGQRGRMSLLAPDGRIVGLPKHPLVQNDDDIRKSVLKQPADAGFTHLANAWALWESSDRPYNKPIPFTLEDEEWLATFVPVRNSALNSAWVARLMGFPDGWTITDGPPVAVKRSTPASPRARRRASP